MRHFYSKLGLRKKYTGAAVIPSRRQQARAMPWLRRHCGDLASDRDALARRQRDCEFDLGDQQIERLLRMGLDELQLREDSFEGLDVVAVLHFIEPIVRRAFF